MFFFVICFILSISVNDSTKIRFDNHKLIGLKPENFRQLKFLNQLHLNSDFDVWNNIRSIGEELDVRLAPESYLKYKKVFDLLGIDHRIKNDDIQTSIEMESWQNNIYGLRKYVSITNNSKYLDYQQITNLMKRLSSENSYFVSNYSAGKTHLGRDIMVLRLKTPTSQRSMWLDCGIHAREWITISSCVYIMEKLISSYANKDLDVVKLLDFYEIHIMPVVNPDGYEHSRTVDRMWRKNRSPPNLFGCSGVDLNRNFGFYWLTAGSSNYECSPVYAGQMPDSEPETQALERAILLRQSQWDSYVSLHSYGQFFFTPWGFTSVLPSDYEELKEKAVIATEAIKLVNGSEFTVGSSSNLLYMSSGGSEDWVKAKAGIKYAYSVELGPKESSNGFIVPESHIPIAGEEIYQGLLALYSELMKEKIRVF